MLAGVHGAGKSTLGRFLDPKRFSYEPEIGSVLRRLTDRSVSATQPEFDRQVMSMEFDRDARRISNSRIPVIETWHLGNLAFAENRGSSQVSRDYRARLGGELSKYSAHVIELNITDEEFLARNSESSISTRESLEFYRGIESRTHELMREYESSHRLALTLDGAAPVEQLSREIEAMVRASSWLGGA